MDGAVFATYPCAHDETWRDADEPGIGVVVRRARLASEVSVGSLVVAHEAHQAGAGAAHAALEQLLYEEGGAIGDGWLGLCRSLEDDVAVAVFNLGHEHWVYLSAVVHWCTIGIDHFEQVDVAGTEGERWGGVELRLDTHLVGSIHDVVDAALLSQTDGYGVDTHGKGLLQGDVRTREVAVGIGGSPGNLLAVIHHLHREEFILAVVAGGDALIHGFGVDEELEGGARLSHGGDLVVLP